MLANIETPKGVRLAAEIATADPRVAGLQIGFKDLFSITGIDSSEAQAMYSIRVMVRLAAAEGGIPVFDTAYSDVKNPDGFRVEAEAAMIWGEIGNIPGLNADVGNPIFIRQFGVATQTQYLAVDDKLNLQFGFGWASGDPWAVNTAGSTQMAISPAPSLPTQTTNGPLSTFAFHPDYRVDLIFFRNIMSQIQGAYYFRPSIDYDFVHHADGEKLGGGVAGIWSRASEFVQTPGAESDLGIELDGQIYYQSKDGSLNDDPSKIGGFYSMLQYGVFFPLAGLNYLSVDIPSGRTAGLSAAQTVRLFLGIAF